jgi:rare lipoprotein A
MQNRLLILPVMLALVSGCFESREADANDANLTQKGKASYYSRSFQGKETASGETFNQNELVAAHKTLPFDTRVRVTNLENGKKVTVRINDRGPYKPGRIIDLSRVAANKIDLLDDGVAPVRIETLD